MLTQAQKDTLNIVIEDHIEDCLENDYLEYLLMAIRNERPETNTLSNYLNIEVLNQYEIPAAIAAQMNQVKAAIHNNESIPNNIIEQLSQYPNYDLYNLAELQRLKLETNNLPKVTSDFLVYLREGRLGMTPLQSRPRYSLSSPVVEYRVDNLPFGLDRFSDYVSTEVIREYITFFVESKIGDFLTAASDIPGEVLYKQATAYIAKQKYIIANKLLSKAIDNGEHENNDDNDNNNRVKYYYQRIYVYKLLNADFNSIRSDFTKIFELVPTEIGYQIEFINLCLETGTEQACQQAINFIEKLLDCGHNLNKQAIECNYKLKDYQNTLVYCWEIILNDNPKDYLLLNQEFKYFYLALVKQVGLQNSLNFINISEDHNNEEKRELYLHLIELFPDKIDVFISSLNEIKLQNNGDSFKDLTEFFNGLHLLLSVNGKNPTAALTIKALIHFSEAEKWGINAEMYLAILYKHPGFDSAWLIEVGASYLHGKTVDKDLNIAKKWFQLAAERYNDPRAYYQLAKLHHEGIHGTKNLLEAARFYLRITKSWERFSEIDKSEYQKSITECISAMVKYAFAQKEQGNTVIAINYLQTSYLLKPYSLNQDSISNVVILLWELQQPPRNNLFDSTVTLPNRILETAKSLYRDENHLNNRTANWSQKKLNEISEFLENCTSRQLPSRLLASDLNKISTSTASLLIKHNIFYKKDPINPHISTNLKIDISREIQNQVDEVICANHSLSPQS